MKIAYIYDAIYPYRKGGAEKRFWELARRLSLKGHEVHIFGVRAWDGQNYFIKEGVYMHGVGSPKELYLKTGIRSPWQALYFTVLILPALWREKLDVVDCNVFPYLPFFPVKFFCLCRRVPLVITWQEVWDRYWYKYLGLCKGHLARIIERMVIKLSRNIIAHSLMTKRKLVRCGAREDNIRMIPNGIDLKAIEEVPPHQESYDLVFLGRLIKDKNADILIKSVALIKRDFYGIRCLIIGSGPEQETLISLAQELGLEENVIFKGFLEHGEIISYMKSAKGFVFPSTREGFGIVVIEAMACGLPVVAVKHPMNAATELIADGKNGFLCGLDAADIAQKILYLLSHEDARKRLSAAAQDHVKTYGWDSVAENNEDFYNDVIGKINAGRR